MIEIEIDKRELTNLIAELNTIPEVVESAIRESAIEIVRLLARRIKAQTGIALRKLIVDRVLLRISLTPEEIITTSRRVAQNRRRRAHYVRPFTRRNGSRVRGHIRKGRVNYTLPQALRGNPDNQGFWIGYPNNLRGRRSVNGRLEPVAVNLRELLPEQLIEDETLREILLNNILKRL